MKETAARGEERYLPLYLADDEYWWCQGMRSVVSAVLDESALVAAPMHVLDAGCGAGAQAEALSARHRVVGADRSMAAIRRAQGRRLTCLAVADVTRLPFRAESFDLVLLLDVLFHENVSEDALRELARVLRPGGWLLVRTPAYQALSSAHDRAMATGRRLSKGELRQILNRSGFVAQRMTYANMILFPPAAAWRLLRGRLWPSAGADIFRLPAWLNSGLARILHFEAGLLRHMDLPFGLSLLCLARRHLPEASA
jgi:SAM-dependent methyltransferase